MGPSAALTFGSAPFCMIMEVREHTRGRALLLHTTNFAVEDRSISVHRCWTPGALKEFSNKVMVLGMLLDEVTECLLQTEHQWLSQMHSICIISYCSGLPCHARAFTGLFSEFGESLLYISMASFLDGKSWPRLLNLL